MVISTRSEEYLLLSMLITRHVKFSDHVLSDFHSVV